MHTLLLSTQVHLTNAYSIIIHSCAFDQCILYYYPLKCIRPMHTLLLSTQVHLTNAYSIIIHSSAFDQCILYYYPLKCIWPMHTLLLSTQVHLTNAYSISEKRFNSERWELRSSWLVVVEYNGYSITNQEQY